eukprot:TRINITY_DN4187_c0_g1_i1.p2 TRINITY_DN4187_c0_g1~~TRINITY_DN4187_c0_g1_i1.p2  ORF type:complete len:726 (+),score=323.18 TRINITY_DN4187_c0_g1_i1:64-2241(+)
MPATMKNAAAVLAVAALSADAAVLNTEVAANPIRKVVTMLQKLEAKVRAEQKSDEELHQKYMCYCKNGAADLDLSISSSDAKIPEVESAIKEAIALKAQLDEDLKNHQADRSDAKATMAKATAIREKEAKVYAGVKAEAETNVAAIKSAVNALEKGMAGFLQTKTAQKLKSIVQSGAAISDVDRDSLLVFLAGSSQDAYSPQSGQITGILKEMDDQMTKDLDEATSEENASKASYEELMAAKTKEVNALTKAIEDKTIRTGETAVNIVQMKNDLSDTEAALLEDKQFLADLDKNCKEKEAAWEEISQTRSEELVALADTIKLLNDDDALELFKKTLPSASASLVQVESRESKMRTRALDLLRTAQQKLSRPSRTSLDFIALALNGKKVGFEKVIKMIDAMVDTLKTEQLDDDNKKEYCSKQFDETDDKRKSLEQSISDSETAMEDAESSIATLTDEIKALQKGIKALDKSVAEATEQRKEEHTEYSDLIANNNAAVGLLGVAKNRLNKFYNKKLYKAPPKRELSEEDRIAVSMGGTAPPTPAPGGIAGTGIEVLAQVSAHRGKSVEAPGPAPEAPSYSKKSEESTGVIAMIDLLVKELEKEITEAEVEEKNAQEEYEKMAGDAAAKRAADSTSVTEKEAAKANTEAALQTHKDAKLDASKELMATVEYIASLHSECDWLMQNFDARKEARSSEVEALGNAKAVLSGADYALVQTAARLRGSAASQ